MSKKSLTMKMCPYRKAELGGLSDALNDNKMFKSFTFTFI